MGKKSGARTRIPKKVLGVRLSKGSRKDLGRLVKLIEGRKARAIAMAAASVAFGYLAEKASERKGPLSKLAGKAAALAPSH